MPLRGLGLAKACRLVAAIELGARAAATPLAREKPLTSSVDVFNALQHRFLHETREHLLAIPLNAKNTPLAEVTIAVGGLAACMSSPGDVFRQILRYGCHGFILVHNHPSGDCRPSVDDLSFTRQIEAAGEVIGISVVDHVVIGHGEFFSFRDEGLLHGGKPISASQPNAEPGHGNQCPT